MTDAPSHRPSRRRFLVAAAVLPVVGASPIVIDRLRSTGDPSPGLAVRITSNDGRFQALSEPLASGASIYAPGPRTESTIVVRDQLTDTSRTLVSDRNLEPEAFSPDGQTLFAIDHRPAQDPVAYRVSTVDVASGEVLETLGPRKLPLVEEMTGEARQQVWSPRGDQLYTLYIRQYHQHPGVDEPTVPHDHADAVDAFVHVLDVSADWALCVELPSGFGLGPSGTTAIMVDDTGTEITVVDHALAMKVVVTRLPHDPENPGGFGVSAPIPLG